MQNGDGWIAVQDAFVFGVPQFIDTGLLLGQQFAAVNRRHSCRNTAVERTFPAQMGNMGSADHDLGRHTADIDAGAADGAAFDQRDRRALLDGLQRRRHRGPAAANDGDMQTGALKCITDFWFIFEITNPDRALITQCGDGGQQLVVAHGGVCHDLRAAFWIGHHSGIHAGNLFQSIFDMGGAGCAGHAIHGDFGHFFTPLNFGVQQASAWRFRWMA